jgi:hypothetical protein
LLEGIEANAKGVEVDGRFGDRISAEKASQQGYMLLFVTHDFLSDGPKSARDLAGEIDHLAAGGGSSSANPLTAIPFSSSVLPVTAMYRTRLSGIQD